MLQVQALQTEPKQGPQVTSNWPFIAGGQLERDIEAGKRGRHPISDMPHINMLQKADLWGHRVENITKDRTDNWGQRTEDWMENKMASLCRRAEVKAFKSRAEGISLKEAEEELTIKII